MALSQMYICASFVALVPCSMTMTFVGGAAEEPDEPLPDESVLDEPVLDEPVLDEPVLDEPVLDELVPAADLVLPVAPASVAEDGFEPPHDASRRHTAARQSGRILMKRRI